jgi:hypothetical protein
VRERALDSSRFIGEIGDYFSAGCAPNDVGCDQSNYHPLEQ